MLSHDIENAEKVQFLYRNQMVMIMSRISYSPQRSLAHDLLTCAIFVLLPRSGRFPVKGAGMGRCRAGLDLSNCSQVTP
jgi:hypothetical protein